MTNQTLREPPWSKRKLSDEEFKEAHAEAIRSQNDVLLTARKAAAASGRLSPEELQTRWEQTLSLVKQVSSNVRNDNGAAFVKLVDFVEGKIEIELAGACSTCSATTATIDRSIRREIGKRTPWINPDNYRGLVDQRTNLPQNQVQGINAFQSRFAPGAATGTPVSTDGFFADR